MTLLGSDDFNGTTIDTTLWAVYDGVNESSGEHWNAAQCTVGANGLNLNASPLGLTGVAGKTQFVYGTFEVRARFSPSLDTMLNPVFLFWPQLDASWPAAGEIDFVECYDPTRQTYQSWNHYATTADVAGADYAGSHKVDMTQWHVYRVEWTPKLLVLKVDGKTWHTYTTHVPAGPMHVVFQIDAAGPVTATASVQIDYFHVLA